MVVAVATAAAAAATVAVVVVVAVILFSSIFIRGAAAQGKYERGKNSRQEGEL